MSETKRSARSRAAPEPLSLAIRSASPATRPKVRARYAAPPKRTVVRARAHRAMVGRSTAYTRIRHSTAVPARACAIRVPTRNSTRSGTRTTLRRRLSDRPPATQSRVANTSGLSDVPIHRL